MGSFYYFVESPYRSQRTFVIRRELIIPKTITKKNQQQSSLWQIRRTRQFIFLSKKCEGTMQQIENRSESMAIQTVMAREPHEIR